MRSNADELAIQVARFGWRRFETAQATLAAERLHRRLMEQRDRAWREGWTPWPPIGGTKDDTP